MKHISIKSPCHKKWNDLKGDDCQRFCSSCSKDIIDLTQKSNTDIVELVMNTKGRLCGRIRKDQVDNILHKGKKNARLSKFMFLFLFGFAHVSNTQTAEVTPTQIVKDFGVETSLVQIQPKLTATPQDSLIRITGRVIDQTDSTELPSVLIKVKKTELSFRTDLNGSFSFELNENQLKESKRTLEFFFLGYKTQEIKITNHLRPLIIKMEQEEIILGEIRIPWYKRLWWTITSPFRKKS